MGKYDWLGFDVPASTTETIAAALAAAFEQTKNARRHDDTIVISTGRAVGAAIALAAGADRDLLTASHAALVQYCHRLKLDDEATPLAPPPASASAMIAAMSAPDSPAKIQQYIISNAAAVTRAALTGDPIAKPTDPEHTTKPGTREK